MRLQVLAIYTGSDKSLCHTVLVEISSLAARLGLKRESHRNQEHEGKKHESQIKK